MGQKSYRNIGRIQMGLFVLFITFLSSCVKSKEFKPLDSTCNADLVANATFAQVKALYDEETLQIYIDPVLFDIFKKI